MKVTDIEDYYEIFDKLIDLISIVEDAIESGIKDITLENFV